MRNVAFLGWFILLTLVAACGSDSNPLDGSKSKVRLLNQNVGTAQLDVSGDLNQTIMFTPDNHGRVVCAYDAEKARLSISAFRREENEKTGEIVAEGFNVTLSGEINFDSVVEIIKNDANQSAHFSPSGREGMYLDNGCLVRLRRVGDILDTVIECADMEYFGRDSDQFPDRIISMKATVSCDASSLDW